MRSIKYECVRCEGEYFVTADLIKSHFRDKHGIFPEQLSAENRKIYDKYFEVPDTNVQGQERDLNGEVTSDEDEFYDALDALSPDDDAIDKYPDTSLTLGSTPEPDKCDQMTDSVQDMEVATDNKQTKKFKFTLDDLITSQGKGPYFCPDCGKGIGYLRHAFKAHVGYYQGRCKSINAGRKFDRCVHCKTDFSRSSRLNLHNTKFGAKCKTMHLSQNNKSIMDNFKGEIREPLRDEDNSTDAALVIDANFYNDLKAEQGNGPYFCPFCGKGVGGLFSLLKIHLSKLNGTCRKRYTGRKFYPCQICKADFMSVYLLKSHQKKYGKLL